MSNLVKLPAFIFLLSGFLAFSPPLIAKNDDANSELSPKNKNKIQNSNSVVESEFTNSMVDELTACGLSKFSQADFSGALLDFTRAIKLAPKKGSLYLQQGLALLELKDFPSAIRSLNTAYDLDRANRQAILLCRGKASLGLSEYESALSDFNQAIKLNPRLPLSYIGRADTYQCMGQEEKALVDLEEAIKLDPEQPEAYFLRARYYHKKKLHEKATTDFEKAVELDRKYIGRKLSKADEKQAQYELATSMKLGKDRLHAAELISNGLALYRAGNHLEAIKALDDAISNDPDSLEAYKWRASVYLHMSSFLDANADLTRAISLTPKDPELYSERARAALGLGKINEALDDYSKAIELSSLPPAALFESRGLLYSRLGRSTEAIADFTKAIQADPKVAGTYLNRGLEYLVQKEKEKAGADLSQAIELNPDLAVAYKFRAQLKSAAGNKEGAINDLQKAAALYLQQKDLYGSKQASKLLNQLKKSRP